MVTDDNWELIHAARTDGRCRLAAQEEALRQQWEVWVVFMHTIVKARHIHHLGKARPDGIVRTVHALRDRTRGVEHMAESLQPHADLAALLAPLFRDFVAD